MRQAEPSQALLASVLVLNRFYMAVHVVGVRRAFGLLYREAAEVISVEQGQYANYDFESWVLLCGMRREERPSGEDWIRSVSFEVQVPRVIRLLRYDRVPKLSLRFNRRSVLARDEHQCQYCGVTLPPSQLSLDHVVPRSRGGLTSWENVVCSCVACNTRKGGRTPQEARMRLRKKPAKPRRNPILLRKLDNPKYVSWRTFLPAGHSSTEPGKNGG